MKKKKEILTDSAPMELSPMLVAGVGAAVNFKTMGKKTIEECMDDIMIKRGFTGGWKEVEPIIKDTHLDADDIKRMVGEIAELYAYHSGLHDACTYEDKAFEDQKRYADVAETMAKDRAIAFASFMESRNCYLERITIEQGYEEFIDNGG